MGSLQDPGEKLLNPVRDIRETIGRITGANAKADKQAADAKANRKEAEAEGQRYKAGGMVRRGWGKARGA